MNRAMMEECAARFISETPLNSLSAAAALSPGMVGMELYEAPLIGVGSATDPLFAALSQSEQAGCPIGLPTQWLPGAKSVISIFLPFSDRVLQGNARDLSGPSQEWLHARYEGQICLMALCSHLKGQLEAAGFGAVVPAADQRFWSKTRPTAGAQSAVCYTSNWSERHVAFVCGLGTFGLSKNLITAKGVAGRFGSVVTDLALDADTRAYTELYGYCIRCGACAHNCPARAITQETGKDHKKCWDFLEPTLMKNRPRYGCGKCQVRVPCAREIPRKQDGG